MHCSNTFEVRTFATHLEILHTHLSEDKIKLWNGLAKNLTVLHLVASSILLHQIL